jgi:Pentapeptide repeats (8 copies)
VETVESLIELSASASKNAVEGLLPGGILTGEDLREFFTVAFNVESEVS